MTNIRPLGEYISIERKNPTVGHRTTMNKWTIFGLIAALGSIAGYFIFPAGLNYGVKSQLNLAKNGMVFPIWSKPPFLTNATMYLFEVENPREALNGEKVRVKRRGPYEFKVANLKENAQFSSSEDQVTLTAVRRFYFEPDGSANIDERFYMLNPIVPSTYLLVTRMIMDKLPFKRVATPLVFNAVNAVLDGHKERLFMKKAPRQLLFGYKVQLLENVSELAKRFGMGSLVPEGPPDNVFGLAFFQNVTEDQFTLLTGVGPNKDNVGQIIKWRGKEKMTMWKGQCNKIEGTNGEIYRPFPTMNKPIKIFLAQMCRSIQLDPVGRVNTSAGLVGLEYALSDRNFQGARSNPSNICYCKDNQAPDCQYDGLMTLEPCMYNVPVYLSKANFKDVDPRLSTTTEGIRHTDKPDKQSFYLEPITGTVLGAELALMASFKVQRQQFMRDLGNVRNLSYVPFFLTHEKIAIPSEVSGQLKALTMLANHYGMGFLVYGALAGVMVAYGLNKKPKDEKSNDNDIDMDHHGAADDSVGGSTKLEGKKHTSGTGELSDGSKEVMSISDNSTTTSTARLIPQTSGSSTGGTDQGGASVAGAGTVPKHDGRVADTHKIVGN